MDSSGKAHLVLWVEEDPFFRAHLGYFIDLLDKYEEDEKENFNSVSIRWTSAKSQKVHYGYSDLTLEKIGLYKQPCVHILLFGSHQLMGDEMLETQDISPQTKMIDKFLRHAALHPEQGFLFVGALPINEPLDDGWSPRKVEDYDNLCRKFNLRLHQEVSSYLDGDLSWSSRRDGFLGKRKRWNCRYTDPASFLCDPKTQKLARNAHQRDGITLTQSAVAHIFPHLLMSATSLFRAMEHEKRVKKELEDVEDEELPPLEPADESVDEAGTGRRPKTPTSGGAPPEIPDFMIKAKRDRPSTLSRLRSCLKHLKFEDEELQGLLAPGSREPSFGSLSLKTKERLHCLRSFLKEEPEESDPEDPPAKETEEAFSTRYSDWGLKSKEDARPRRYPSLRSFLNKEEPEESEPEGPLAKEKKKKGTCHSNPFRTNPIFWTPRVLLDKKDEPADAPDALTTDSSEMTSAPTTDNSEKDTSPEQTAPVIETRC